MNKKYYCQPRVHTANIIPTIFMEESMPVKPGGADPRGSDPSNSKSDFRDGVSSWDEF